MRVQTEDPQLDATRSSLVRRLRDLDDYASWRKFFNTYWKLLYNVARQAGLEDADAQDVVQQAVVGIVRHLPGFVYDRGRGTFKGWLLTVLRSRIADFYRKRKRQPELVGLDDVAWPEAVAPDLERVWDEEWSRRLVGMALEKTKARVSPRQYQIFHSYMVQEWSMQEVTETLRVTRKQVYLAKQRVGKVFEVEVRRLEGSLT